MIFWRVTKKGKPKESGLYWIVLNGKVDWCWYDPTWGFGMRGMRTGIWIPVDGEVTHWAPMEIEFPDPPSSLSED